MVLIDVPPDSYTDTVGDCMVTVVRKEQQAEFQALSSEAINVSVNAIVLANSYLLKHGLQVGFVPRPVDVRVDGKRKTGIRFALELRKL